MEVEVCMLHVTVEFITPLHHTPLHHTPLHHYTITSYTIEQVDVPKQYGTDARIQLQADANIVNLNKLGPYYYEKGIKLLSLDAPDTDPIAEVLIKVLRLILCSIGTSQIETLFAV